MRSKNLLWSYAAVLLLLIFWISRTHNLLTLPIFLDESWHLTRAQWVWEGRPFYLLETGKALAPYVAALFWPFSAAPFIGRYVVVLFGAIGLASAYAIGRELHSRHAGLLCMALWIICPQLMFFERMALVDTTISATALLALWAAIRMIKSGKITAAIGCGVGLAMIVLAKLTGLTFLPIPIMVLVLVKSRQKWPIRIRQVVIAYGVAALLLAWPLLYIRSVNADPTGQSSGLTTTRLDTLVDRVSGNLAKTWDAEQVYHSRVMLWILLFGAIFAVSYAPRSGLLLLALGLAPLAAIAATAAGLWLRYLSPTTPFFLLLASIGMLLFIEEIHRLKIPPPIKRAAYALPWLVAAGWAIGVGIPFQLTAYADPTKLPLPETDYSEYIFWIPSGYGIRDAAKYLETMTTEPITVIGTAVNCNAARLYMPLGSNVKFICPDLDWAGGNYGVIKLIQDEADKLGHVYVLGEVVPIVTESQLPKPNVLIREFSRPTINYGVKLYRIDSSKIIGYNR